MVLYSLVESARTISTTAEKNSGAPHLFIAGMVQCRNKKPPVQVAFYQVLRQFVYGRPPLCRVWPQLAEPPAQATLAHPINNRSSDKYRRAGANHNAKQHRQSKARYSTASCNGHGQKREEGGNRGKYRPC